MTAPTPAHTAPAAAGAPSPSANGEPLTPTVSASASVHKSAVDSVHESPIDVPSRASLEEFKDTVETAETVPDSSSAPDQQNKHHDGKSQNFQQDPSVLENEDSNLNRARSEASETGAPENTSLEEVPTAKSQPLQSEDALTRKSIPDVSEKIDSPAEQTLSNGKTSGESQAPLQETSFNTEQEQASSAIKEGSSIKDKAPTNGSQRGAILSVQANSQSTVENSSGTETKRSSVYFKQQKELVTKELEELKLKILKRSEASDSDASSLDEDKFADILDSAFKDDATLSGKDKVMDLDDFNKFLEEHRKIDNQLVNAKQSKRFFIKSKTTKRVRKSGSVTSLQSGATSSTNIASSLRPQASNNAKSSSLYALDNSSRTSLSNRLIRKISTRRSKDNTSIYTQSSVNNDFNLGAFDNDLNKPPTVQEVSSEESDIESTSDKEIITYKKVFKNNEEVNEEEISKIKAQQKTKKLSLDESQREDITSAHDHNNTTIIEDSDENIETFQFQFEFSKIKIDEDKLKFSDSVNQALEKQKQQDQKKFNDESRVTTLISNSNGKVVTTHIRQKQQKKPRGGFGFGIANLYSSLFGWRKTRA